MIKAFDICNILLHIMLISAFLGSYFFTFGAYLEREILKDQLDYLVETTLQPVRILFPNISNDVKHKLKSYNFKIDQNADKRSIENNKKTVDTAIKFITTFFIIGFIVILYLAYIMDRGGLTMGQFIVKLLKHNLIILIFIAMTEFIFAYFFARKYMSLDINRLKQQIFLSLDKIKNTKLPNVSYKQKIDVLNTEIKDVVKLI